MTSPQASSAYPASALLQTKASDTMCNSETDGSTTKGHIRSRAPAGSMTGASGTSPQSAKPSKLSKKARAVLLTAKPDWEFNGRTFYTIKRTLGYRTWASGGHEGARADIAELYRKGLITEGASPWSRYCFLTDDGEQMFRTLTGGFECTDDKDYGYAS